VKEECDLNHLFILKPSVYEKADDFASYYGTYRRIDFSVEPGKSSGTN
jgi:hypothetical protein